MHRLSATMIMLTTLLVSSPCSALVVTEIMFNPPGTDEDLEFIELYNQRAGPEDLSGYKFTEGIHYVFTTELQPNGRPVASMGPGEYLILAKNAAAFEAQYGFAPFGQYEGNLSNSGDTLLLENDAGEPYDPVENTRNRRRGGAVISFGYEDNGKWPTACDGTGYTLSLISPFSEQDDPDSWTISPQLWGTPGGPNGLQDEWIDEMILEGGGACRYLKGTSEPPAEWNERSFNDASWSTGTLPLGYDEGNDYPIATELPDMSGNYFSVYTRMTFTVTDPGAVENLVLGVYYDDGFVAYINGTEVYRANLTGLPPAHDENAGNHEASTMEQFTIAADMLEAGENVLAIQAHNTSLGSSDFVIDTQLSSRRLLRSPTGAAKLVINEALFKTSLQTPFVEIHNTSSASIPLTGYYLSTDPNQLDAHPLSGTLAAGGFLAVEEQVALPLSLEFQDPPPEPPDVDYGTLRVFLTHIPEGDTSAAYVVSAENFSGHMQSSWSIGRIPDGGDTWFRISSPSKGAENTLAPTDVNTDIVINEIMYHPFFEDNPYDTSDDAETGRELEFVELYNRGASAVDLSGWRFSRGISYTFPEGFLMEADSYLVIAKSPDLIRSIYNLPSEIVVGPFSGGLSNNGEKLRIKDGNNNTVDEVRFYDAGRWDKWADGLGSSLELIDPDQENDYPGAWKASDDSDKAEWTTVSYSGMHNEFSRADSEVHMYLKGKGEVLIDDLKFSTSSSLLPNLIPGGGDFDSSSDFTGFWRGGCDNGGNHIDSHWTNDYPCNGAGCLKLIASGRGDTRFNRFECNTTSGLSRRTYYVQYRARWLRGFNLIMTRTTGHNIARSSPIQVPQNLGTPGERNSVYKANLGPVYQRLTQDPAVPSANEPVKVTVEIHDSDGVAGTELKYRRDTNSTFSTAPMNDSGTDGDAKAGDHIWTGTIPGQPAGTIMEFYVEATDWQGNITRHPPLPDDDAPPTVMNDIAIYLVGDAQTPGNRPLYRIILTHQGEDALDDRATLSNHLVPCSFVLNENEIFYNCGFRFRGSPFIRGNGCGGNAWNGLRVRFPADHKLFGELTEINLDASGHTNQHDRTAYYLERKMVAATPGVHTCWSWGIYADIRYRAGGTTHNSIYDHIQKVDADYLGYWWDGKDDGFLHKVDDWFEYVNDSNRSNWQADLTYHGVLSTGAFCQKENYYRYQYKLRSREKHDDFSHLIDLTYALTNWSADRIDSEITSIMDVKQWSTILCPRFYIDDWDTLGANRGKNSYIYLPSPDLVPVDPNNPAGEQELSQEQWKLIPWDSDLTFGNTSALIFPGGAFPQMQKLYNRPFAKRQLNSNYLYLINEVVRTPALSAWVNWVASSVGIGGTNLPGWCETRASNVLGRIPSGDTVPFGITSPVGTTFVTNTPTITIEGQAPYDVEVITLNGEDITDTLIWSGSEGTGWEYGPVALTEGDNNFTFGGYSRTGGFQAQDILHVLVTDEDPPEITTIFPQEGISIGGETITIRGGNFQDGLTVHFGETEAQQVDFVDEGELTVVTPPHPAGAVAVKIINPDGLPTFYEPFTYIPIPAPVVYDAYPNRGYTAGGSVVQIRGNYLQEGARVFFDGEEAGGVTVWGLQDLEATVPAHAAGFASIRILNVDQQEFTLEDGFLYVTTPAPELGSITPPEGPTSGGNTVTIEGDNFYKGTEVYFSGKQASAISFVSTTELSCTVPAGDLGDSFVSVRIENPDGQYAWLPSSYRYVNGVKSCSHGDANGDGTIDISDVMAVLKQLFSGGDLVLCEQAADANSDEKLDLSDAVSLLSRIFAKS